MLRLKAFLESCVVTLLKRSVFLLALNVLFFSLFLVGAFLARFPEVMVYELPASESLLDVSISPLLLAVGIFLFNLVVSGLLLTTLSGLLVFAIPVGLISWRALLWGTLIAQLPSPQFFWALPTFILEGEGYVIAALAGVILGLSWLKPNWAFQGESLSRRQALGAAFKECVRLYVWVAVLLLVGAVVEAITIMYAISGLLM